MSQAEPNPNCRCSPDEAKGGINTLSCPVHGPTVQPSLPHDELEDILTWLRQTHHQEYTADRLQALILAQRQEARLDAFNEVWQSFKQQYGDTDLKELEPWLRSFVVAANIKPEHLQTYLEGEQNE